MPLTGDIDYGQPIPVFPLERPVLLPHAAVPLHVFEPRYVAMTRDALEGSRLIAMAVFEGEAWIQTHADKPPIKPCVCVGRIVEHQALPGGRYNLLLQGRERARIIEELPPRGRGYRAARLEPIETQPAMEIDLTPHRKRLAELIEDPVMTPLASMKQAGRWITADLPTTAVVDATTLVLCRGADERYAALAEPDAHQRARRLIEALREVRSVLRAAEPMSRAAKTREGLYLN